MDELEAALEEGYPSLLYWMGHASPEFLRLGEHEVITPFALRNLLLSFYDRESLSGTLVFLNASWTAKVGSEGSFLNVLQNIGFTGAIVTEGPVIDNFANGFGVAFLQGFLREGKPVGELLHGLRIASAPLGLIYGAYCPPEIRVARPSDLASPKWSPITASGARGVFL